MFWARIFTAYYFLHFLVVMPIVGLTGEPAAAAALDHRGGAGQDAAPSASAAAAKALKGASMSRADVACSVRGGLLLGLVSLAGAAAVKAARTQEARSTRSSVSPGRLRAFRGQFDKAQLQRGFQVYQKVCSACHGLKRVRFRNLAEPGGPEFPEASVKALAIGWPNKISGEPDDQGKRSTGCRALADPDPRPLQERQAGARGPERRAAAGPLADRQGARVESTAPWYTHWF